jgi:hypothetical protein
MVRAFLYLNGGLFREETIHGNTTEKIDEEVFK